MSLTFCRALLLLSFTAFAAAKMHSGSFSKKFNEPGYYLVASVPKGSTSINVTDVSSTKNYLAVRTSDGRYVFNGDYNITSSGDYTGAGTHFVYLRRSTWEYESFYAFGPLDTSIDIMLIYQKDESKILYEYDYPPVYDRDLRSLLLSPPAPLRATTQSPKLENRLTATTSSYTSANVMMGDERSTTEATKRRRKRMYMWMAVDFSKCSKPCGGGFQYRRYICIRKRLRKQVANRFCKLLIKPNPEPVRCNNSACPPKWQGGPWGRCSVTCGNGTRRRDLQCIQEISDSLQHRLENHHCSKESAKSIPLEETCFMPDCSAYINNNSVTGVTTKQYIAPPHWKKEEWSPCSTTCGDGVRVREVTCVTPLGIPCDPNEQPASEEPCNLGTCPTKSTSENDIPEPLTETMWMYSAWPESCPAECGTGIKTRTLYCDNFVKNKTCDEKNMPVMNKTCTTQTCGQWFVGPWTQCSSSCDIGVATREVVCVSRFLGYLKVVDSKNCLSDKPVTTKGCRGPPCNATWFMSDWSQCSQTCGSGIQRRVVKCIGPDGMPINETISECDDDKRPPSKRRCNEITCSDKPDLDNFGKECRDTLSECRNLRNKTKESKYKCKMEIYKKTCCKACRYYSYISSTG